MPLCSVCTQAATISCKGCAEIFCKSDWEKKHICGGSAADSRPNLLFVVNPDSGRERTAMRYLPQLPTLLKDELPGFALHSSDSNRVDSFVGVPIKLILIVDAAREITDFQRVLLPRMQGLFPDTPIVYMRLFESDAWSGSMEERVKGNDSGYDFVMNLFVSRGKLYSGGNAGNLTKLKQFIASMPRKQMQDQPETSTVKRMLEAELEDVREKIEVLQARERKLRKKLYKLSNQL